MAPKLAIAHTHFALTQQNHCWWREGNVEKLMNPFVVTLELLLEIAGRTPFPIRQSNYESETPGRVNLRNSLKPLPNILL